MQATHINPASQTTNNHKQSNQQHYKTTKPNKTPKPPNQTHKQTSTNHQALNTPHKLTIESTLLENTIITNQITPRAQTKPKKNHKHQTNTT